MMPDPTPAELFPETILAYSPHHPKMIGEQLFTRDEDGDTCYVGWDNAGHTLLAPAYFKRLLSQGYVLVTVAYLVHPKVFMVTYASVRDGLLIHGWRKQGAPTGGEPAKPKPSTDIDAVEREAFDHGQPVYEEGEELHPSEAEPAVHAPERFPDGVRQIDLLARAIVEARLRASAFPDTPDKPTENQLLNARIEARAARQAMSDMGMSLHALASAQTEIQFTVRARIDAKGVVQVLEVRGL